MLRVWLIDIDIDIDIDTIDMDILLYNIHVLVTLSDFVRRVAPKSTDGRLGSA